MEITADKFSALYLSNGLWEKLKELEPGDPETWDGRAGKEPGQHHLPGLGLVHVLLPTGKLKGHPRVTRLVRLSGFIGEFGRVVWLGLDKTQPNGGNWLFFIEEWCTNMEDPMNDGRSWRLYY